MSLVLELLSEVRVVRQLERPDAMRRELMGLQNALHRPQAHPRRLRQLDAIVESAMSPAFFRRILFSCVCTVGDQYVHAFDGFDD